MYTRLLVMKSPLLLTLILLYASLAAAQKSQGVYRVKNGSDVTKVIPFSERYQFDSFADGQVFFRNGKNSKAKLNYSLVHGEVMFINPVSDTLLLNGLDFISKVTIGDREYFYSKGKGHIEVIGDYGGASLGRKIFLVRAGNERYAAYGQYSSTSAIGSYSSYINQNGEFQFLQGSDKVILRRRQTFFLMDKNHEFHYVTRGALLKVYPGHKRAIDDFIKTNNSNFEAEPDLRKLLAFCSTL